MDHHDTNSGEGMLIAHQTGRLWCQLHNCSAHCKKKKLKSGGVGVRKREGGCTVQIIVIHLPFVHVNYSVFTL